MPFEIREVDAKTDFPSIAERLIEAFDDPPQGGAQVFSAPLGEGGEAARIAEKATRYAAWHALDSCSHWYKAVDTDTSEIIGGALWNIHSSNPFAHQHDFVVSWFPDNGSRRFAESFLAQYSAPRAAIGQRPQVYLSIMFTSPKHRRKGVAQQLLSWGIRKAHEMGVEMFLDASLMGKPLYEANGFVVVEENHIVPNAETKDEAWDELEHQVCPPVILYLMWRPAGGKFEEGKTVLPWKNE
ncbi:acyl-CoA N-acyltransferase [Xylaria sp. FL1042]|nr:acyl-CoA N-acyltransferase [Xylaria sp. FL1042]